MPSCAGSQVLFFPFDAGLQTPKWLNSASQVDVLSWRIFALHDTAAEVFRKSRTSNNRPYAFQPRAPKLAFVFLGFEPRIARRSCATCDADAQGMAWRW